MQHNNAWFRCGRPVRFPALQQCGASSCHHLRMEYLLLAVACARIELPPAVLQWALDTATPGFRSWTQLLGRSDVTDEQAWALLWRDGTLERSAEKIPAGSKGYWTSNATSEQLAAHVASYLARPNVPPGTVGRVRERLDGAALTRLDLLREVTRLGGSDVVGHELAAEPPVGSSRGHQLGVRELALVDRYRSNAGNEERARTETITTQVSTILAEDDHWLAWRVPDPRAPPASRSWRRAFSASDPWHRNRKPPMRQVLNGSRRYRAT